MPHRFARTHFVAGIALALLVGVLVALGLTNTALPPLPALGLCAAVAVAGGLLARPPVPRHAAAAGQRDQLIAKLQDELDQLSGQGARRREERLRLLESAVVSAERVVEHGLLAR